MVLVRDLHPVGPGAVRTVVVLSNTATMKRILVSIALSPEGMSTIKATPELQLGEAEFINMLER